jgi:prevent-host-death family protein
MRRKMGPLRSPQSIRKMTSITKMTMKDLASVRTTWAVAEAKARFSEMIDRALADGPQIITRKGKEAVVVVSAEEWQRKTKRTGNLAEFFAASPLRGSGLKIKRTKDRPRAIEL